MHWDCDSDYLPRIGWKMRVSHHRGGASADYAPQTYLLAGVLSRLLYLIVFTAVRLYSDALLQIFFWRSRCTVGVLVAAECAEVARCACAADSAHSYGLAAGAAGSVLLVLMEQIGAPCLVWMRL